MSMHISERGTQLLASWEGLRTHAYFDSGGVLTIGVGHNLTRSERTSGKLLIAGQAVRYAQGLTEVQCWQLLAQDLAPVEDTLNALVRVPLTQSQFDALCSFVLNVGMAAFLGSTLLRLLNQGHYEQIPQQLARWRYDNGKVVPGLINRREKEIALWEQ